MKEKNNIIDLISLKQEYGHYIGLAGRDSNHNDRRLYNVDGKLFLACSYINQGESLENVIDAAEAIIKLARSEETANTGWGWSDYTDQQIYNDFCAVKLRSTAIFLLHIYHLLQPLRPFLQDKLNIFFEEKLNEFNNKVQHVLLYNTLFLDKIFEKIKKSPVDFSNEREQFLKEKKAKAQESADAFLREMKQRHEEFRNKQSANRTIEESTLSIHKSSSVFASSYIVATNKTNSDNHLDIYELADKLKIHKAWLLYATYNLKEINICFEPSTPINVLSEVKDRLSSLNFKYHCDSSASLPFIAIETTLEIFNAQISTLTTTKLS